MSSNKVKPLGKRVLIKRCESQTTKGGIFLPESAQEKPKHGEVIAVGPGEYNKEGVLEKPELKEGDKVLFSSYAGTEIKPSSEDEYLIMNENDVLAVFES